MLQVPHVLQNVIHLITLNDMDKKAKADNLNEADTVSMEEARAILSCSHTHIYRLINRGQLAPLPKPPHFKKQYRLRFRRADVEALRG